MDFMRFERSADQKSIWQETTARRGLTTRTETGGRSTTFLYAVYQIHADNVGVLLRHGAFRTWRLDSPSRTRETGEL